MNLARVSVEEMREVMSRRRPLDRTTVLLGRLAQSLTAAGEVDPELALSYVLWPTPELLEAVGATSLAA